MRKASIRALLIEDNPADVLFMQEALAEDPLATFELAVAEDLRQGLACLQKQRFDVLLLDLGLPDSQGLPTFEQAQRQVPELPVVVFSGMLDEQVAIDAVQAGAQDYLVKGPDGWKLLPRAIRYAIERQQAHVALQASEQRFRALIEHSADAIAMLAADGTALYESRSITRVSGYQPEELVGRSPFDLMHPEDQADSARTFQRVLANPGVPVAWHTRFKHRDGAWIWVEGTSINLLDEPAVRAIVVNYRDVTARTQAEQALGRSAERLTALHAIDQAILLADSLGTIVDTVLGHVCRLIPCEYSVVLLHQAGAATGVVLAASDDAPTSLQPGTSLPLGGVQQSAAFAHGGPLLISDLGVLEPAREWANAAGLRAALLAPLVVRGELLGSLNVLAADSATLTDEHIAIIREVSYMVAIAIYNAQLLEREQRARRGAELLHLASQVLARLLALDDILEALLDVLEQLIPYDSANIMLPDESGIFRVRHLRDYDRWTDPALVATLAFDPARMPLIAEIMATKRSLLLLDTHEHPTWHPLLGTHHIRCWLGVPLIAGNAVVGIYSIDRSQPNSLTAEDVRLAETLAATAATAIERARLFAQLQEEHALLAQRVDQRTADLIQANAELARAARLKDEFLANMSHELRTPLNAILGRSEVLREEIYGPLNARQQTALQGIDESSRHLLGLINDILDLSKLTAGKLELEIEETAVAIMCQACMRLIAQSALGKQISVTTRLDPAVDYLYADVRRLKQILVNLLSNAVKFTPKQGRIGLDVQGDPERQTATFTVWDSGIGIAAEDLPRLFQPFSQIDSKLSRQYEGTGLGLALVSQLTAAHGGSVTVESTLGAGSRFSVTLPWSRPAPDTRQAQAQPSIEPSVSVASSAALSGQHPLILLAEDNPQNRSLVQEYLEFHGYRVALGGDGEEALEQARAATPALILMDIQMPRMDGLEAIRRIRADPALQTIPIIAMTALAMPGDRERCLEAGANEYLTKPVSLQALLAAINAQLQPR